MISFIFGYLSHEIAIAFSEMGLSPFLLIIIIFFTLLFVIAFIISSKNMDSDGIMTWMMAKPKDWIGNKEQNLD